MSGGRRFTSAGTRNDNVRYGTRRRGSRRVSCGRGTEAERSVPSFRKGHGLRCMVRLPCPCFLLTVAPSRFPRLYGAPIGALPRRAPRCIRHRRRFGRGLLSQGTWTVLRGGFHVPAFLLWNISRSGATFFALGGKEGKAPLEPLRFKTPALRECTAKLTRGDAARLSISVDDRYASRTARRSCGA